MSIKQRQARATPRVVLEIQEPTERHGLTKQDVMFLVNLALSCLSLMTGIAALVLAVLGLR
jgi:hypothetical protein